MGTTKRYILNSVDLADFQILAIGDIITDKVICHFNYENEDAKDLAEEIVNFLNSRDEE